MRVERGRGGRGQDRAEQGEAEWSGLDWGQVGGEVGEWVVGIWIGVGFRGGGLGVSHLVSRPPAWAAGGG